MSKIITLRKGLDINLQGKACLLYTSDAADEL